MARQSSDTYYTHTGTLCNGYDYRNQAWVRNGKYEACGHTGPCTCFGKKWQGTWCAVTREENEEVA